MEARSMQEIKLSVIIPIYKVERYIYRALQSCLEQRLPGVEFICVDDGTPDRSGEIAEEYAAIDKRIRVIHKENGGLSSARNAGLSEASGRYVMFLDSDDYLAGNACEKVWERIEATDADIVCFGAEITPAVPEADEWHYWVLSPRNAFFDRFTPRVLFNAVGAKPFVWRQAFRKELLDRTGVLFDETVPYGEDIIFQIQLFPHASRFAFMADKLYVYRWYREGSLMNIVGTDQDKRMSYHLEIVEHICAYWNTVRVSGGRKTLMSEYGSELLSWILDYIVPDFTQRKSERLDEHIFRLQSIFETYDMERFYKKLHWFDKKLWRSVRNNKTES